jgi:hypothetical protein
MMVLMMRFAYRGGSADRSCRIIGKLPPINRPHPVGSTHRAIHAYVFGCPVFFSAADFPCRLHGEISQQYRT